MESFALFRAHLAMNGIVERKPPKSSGAFNSKNVIVIILASLGGISTNKLLVDAKTFDEYTDILYRSIFLYIITIFYAYIVWKTPELFEFIRSLEAVVSNRSALHPELQSIYTEASQRIQKWIKAMHLILIVLTPPLCTLPSVLTSFYAYYTTELGNDAFEFLYSMWFPFGTKGPIRFSVAIVIQYFIVANIMITIECFYLIGIATLPMLFPLTDDIKCDLNALQRSLRDKRKRPRTAKPLSQFIQFHSDARQLARDLSNFSHLMQLTMISYFILGICSDLLLIEIKMHEEAGVDSAEIALFVQMFEAIVTVFGICELGERVSMAFDEISLALDQLKWYLLPREAWKSLPIILVVAQESVGLTIFGSISCNRIVFKEVCNKIYTYFMILQRMNK